MTYDPDAQRFRDYAEGNTNDSPVDLSGREGAPASVDCRLCNKPTPMLGTKLCDRCWELETRIQDSPAIRPQNPCCY